MFLNFNAQECLKVLLNCLENWQSIVDIVLKIEVFRGFQGYFIFFKDGNIFYRDFQGLFRGSCLLGFYQGFSEASGVAGHPVILVTTYACSLQTSLKIPIQGRFRLF